MEIKMDDVYRVNFIVYVAYIVLRQVGLFITDDVLRVSDQIIFFQEAYYFVL